MRTRMAVVLFPPREAVAEAEEFRREHDPLFLRIPAHLTLVFPLRTTGPRRPVEERLAAALSGPAAPGAFEVGLGGAGRYDDGVVFLRVGEGADRLSALHEALSAAALPPGSGPAPMPFLPHLTVARATGSAEAEFLERQAAGRLPAVRFRASRLDLVVEDARGLWHARRRFRLGAAPAPGRDGEPAAAAPGGHAPAAGGPAAAW